MRTIAAASLIIFALFAAAALSSAQDSSTPATPQAAPELTPEQRWLKQLQGQWDAQYKMHMEPNQPPIDAAGDDTVRALGDNWIISETSSTVMGMPFTGILTLGYDTKKKRYVGTWIDSISDHLWVYEGTRNEAGDTLTLNTEGPSIMSIDKTARYKEVITIKDKDHRTFSSSIEGEDGKWITILTAEYQRKK